MQEWTLPQQKIAETFLKEFGALVSVRVMHRKVDRGKAWCVEGWRAHGAIERLAHVAPRVKAMLVKGSHHV